MVPIQFLGLFLFWTIGQQGDTCNWWHGENQAKDILNHCSTKLNKDYKLDIQCSVYALVDAALSIFPNGTTGIRVTNHLESIQPLDVEDTTSCLKMTQSRINKLTDRDDDILATANRYRLVAATFLMLLSVQLLDVFFLFDSNLTVAQTWFDKSCMRLAFQEVANNVTEEVDVSNCMVKTGMIQKLLTPSVNLDVASLYNDFIKNDYLTGVFHYLDEMWLQEFNGTIDRLSLTILRVFRDIPRDVFQFMANRSVTSLSLPNNGFTAINENDLPYIPTLKSLDFSGCNIATIHHKTWDGLVNLEVLDLRRNKLHTIQIPQGKLKNLKILRLDSQEIKGSSFKIDSNPPSLSNLQTLSMSHMKLTDQWQVIENVPSLKELILKNTSLKIPQNAFKSLINLKYLDISDNNFNNEVNIISSLGDALNLKELNLSGCKIASDHIHLFLKAMPQLETLDLSRNSIRELNHVIYGRNDSSIKYLNLRGNSLKSWNQMRFSGAFETVDLSYNNITDIGPVMLSDFQQFKSLKLAGNNFDCSNCLLTAFQDWISQTNTTLDHNEMSPYVCFYPIAKSGQNIMKINLRDAIECLPYFFNWALKVMLPVVLVSYTIFLSGIGIYWNRFYLLYVFHLIRAKWRGRFQNLEDLRFYRYDAFVSYCSDDRVWVLDYLIPNMENREPYLHLCVHERDFQVGEPIMNNIIDCIDASNRSIFILSEKFVQSQWCQWELQMAQHKLFEDSRDVLTIIKLGCLDEKMLPKVLRHLIKKRTYLEWSEDADAQRLFWARLKNNIGKCKCQFHDMEDCHANT